MGKKEKLEARLLSRPTDMTFEEVSTLFGYYGLSQKKTGKAGGSRVRFSNADGSVVIIFHRPHNPGTFKRYLIDQIIDKLKQEGFLR